MTIDICPDICTYFLFKKFTQILLQANLINYLFPQYVFAQTVFKLNAIHICICGR